MPRRVLQDITVETKGDGQPAEFTWRGKQYTVTALLEHWKEAGAWWDGEAERDVFRVLDSLGRIFELHRLQNALFPLMPDSGDSSSGWVLWTVED